MKKHIPDFTCGEEELIGLLQEIGMNRPIALTLVFLANAPEATQRTIASGTGLPQENISIALKYLMQRGWVTCRKIPATKGKAVNHYTLALPVSGILECIGREEVNKIRHLLEQVGKIHTYV